MVKKTPFNATRCSADRLLETLNELNAKDHKISHIVPMSYHIRPQGTMLVSEFLIYHHEPITYTYTPPEIFIPDTPEMREAIRQSVHRQRIGEDLIPTPPTAYDAHGDKKPLCSAEGCHRTSPCGPFCRDNGNFD